MARKVVAAEVEEREEDEEQEEEEGEQKKAQKLKSLAEEKYRQSKLKSALKYAKRAQRLCPDLDGISEMITSFKILHVYSKSSSSGGPPDWYDILQVEPFSHINSIKKQYKNLALVLHPDKNSCIASEEAFKHVAEAFRVLSDKIRRKEYDVKLRIALQSQATTSIEVVEAFWTACSTCRLFHKFERRYLGHILVCPSCNKSFVAVEVTVNDELDEEGRVRTRGKTGAKDFLEKVEKKDSVQRPKRTVTLKRRSDFSYSLEGSRSTIRSHSKKAKIRPEMTLAEMQMEAKRKLLQEKMKLKEKAEKAANVKTKDMEEKLKGKEKGREVEKMDKGSGVKPNRQKGDKEGGTMLIPMDEEGGTMLIPNRRDMEVMMVEDSDFYDFDKDRTERSFKKGQVWAIYDDDDGMPRHYGLINEVVSLNPFEVRMNWLDMQNNGVDTLLCSEKSMFRISCGRFKVSREISIDAVNVFSHLVECERMAKEIYWIFPKKGSIWALYNEKALIQDEENCLSNDERFYDIIICLTSYSEMHGLSMAYLEKVQGFKTVFRRREIGCHAIRWIEKDDFRLFSHQIPSKKLSGTEASELPKDCWELDPASLPPHLLNVGRGG